MKDMSETPARGGRTRVEIRFGGRRGERRSVLTVSGRRDSRCLVFFDIVDKDEDEMVVG